MLNMISMRWNSLISGTNITQRTNIVFSQNQNSFSFSYLCCSRARIGNSQNRRSSYFVKIDAIFRILWEIYEGNCSISRIHLGTCVCCVTFEVKVNMGNDQKHPFCFGHEHNYYNVWISCTRMESYEVFPSKSSIFFCKNTFTRGSALTFYFNFKLCSWNVV